MTFNREPAMILAFVSALVTALSAFIFHLTVDQQGVLNAVAAGVLGVATAWAVKGEKLLAAIVGLAQPLVALALAFGAELTSDQQGAIMPLVTIAAAMWLRTQVVAPEPPTVSRALAVDNAVPQAEPSSGGQHAWHAEGPGYTRPGR